MRIFSMKCEETKLSFKFNYHIHSKASFHTKRKKQNIENETNIMWLGYADDTNIVICVNQKKDLQKAMLLLNRNFEDFGLVLNKSKTETR